MAYLYQKAKIRLMITFYMSTLTLSCCFAIVIAFLASPFIQSFGFALMSGGTILSLLYKEISHKKEYYFYYNMGLSKIMLFVFCAVVNILLGSICIIFQRHV